MKRYQSLLLLVCALALTCGCKKSDPNATAPDGAQIADQHNYDLAEPIKIPELQTEQEYRDFLEARTHLPCRLETVVRLFLGLISVL